MKKTFAECVNLKRKLRQYILEDVTEKELSAEEYFSWLSMYLLVDQTLEIYDDMTEDGIDSMFKVINTITGGTNEEPINIAWKA